VFSFIIGLGVNIIKDTPINIPSILIAGIGAGLLTIGLIGFLEQLSPKLAEYGRRRRVRQILGEEIQI